MLWCKAVSDSSIRIVNVCPLLFALVQRSRVDIDLQHLNASGVEDISDRVDRLLALLKDFMSMLHEHSEATVALLLDELIECRDTETSLVAEDVSDALSNAYSELLHIYNIVSLDVLQGRDVEEIGYRAGKLVRCCVASGALTDAELTSMLKLFVSVELGDRRSTN